MTPLKRPVMLRGAFLMPEMREKTASTAEELAEHIEYLLELSPTAEVQVTYDDSFDEFKRPHRAN